MVMIMTTRSKPDIYANIRFLSTEEGGRILPVIASEELSYEFGFPLEFEGNYFDCRLLLNDIGTIQLGVQVKSVPIKFLTKLLREQLMVGSKFTLWEMGKIAEGVVTKLCWNADDDA